MLWAAPNLWAKFGCFVPVQQAKQLADDLMKRIEPIGFDRHKLIIQVLPHA